VGPQRTLRSRSPCMERRGKTQGLWAWKGGGGRASNVGKKTSLRCVQCLMCALNATARCGENNYYSLRVRDARWPKAPVGVSLVFDFCLVCHWALLWTQLISFRHARCVWGAPCFLCLLIVPLGAVVNVVIMLRDARWQRDETGVYAVFEVCLACNCAFWWCGNNALGMHIDKGMSLVCVKCLMCA